MSAKTEVIQNISIKKVIKSRLGYFIGRTCWKHIIDEIGIIYRSYPAIYDKQSDYFNSVDDALSYLNSLPFNQQN